MSGLPKTICVQAPAKINWFLYVLGRRPDGKHLLYSLFSKLDWYDTLTLTRRNDGRIVRSQAWSQVPAEQDIAVRAAQALQAHAGSNDGVDIVIDKQLPMGAGLGGGSSDAASTLLALNQLWGLGYSPKALADIGEQLGADIPFFILSPAHALVQGIGEQVSPVSIAQSPHLLLIVPSFGCSTAAVFAQYAQMASGGQSQALGERIAVAGGGTWPWESMSNQLEVAALQVQPALALLVKTLRQAGWAPRMTGSGAVFFLQFATRQEAESVALPVQQALASVGLAVHTKVASALTGHETLLRVID